MKCLVCGEWWVWKCVPFTPTHTPPLYTLTSPGIPLTHTLHLTPSCCSTAAQPPAQSLLNQHSHAAHLFEFELPRHLLLRALVRCIRGRPRSTPAPATCTSSSTWAQSFHQSSGHTTCVSCASVMHACRLPRSSSSSSTGAPCFINDNTVGRQHVFHVLLCCMYGTFSPRNLFRAPLLLLLQLTHLHLLQHPSHCSATLPEPHLLPDPGGPPPPPDDSPSLPAAAPAPPPSSLSLPYLPLQTPYPCCHHPLCHPPPPHTHKHSK